VLPTTVADEEDVHGRRGARGEGERSQGSIDAPRGSTRAAPTPSSHDGEPDQPGEADLGQRPLAKPEKILSLIRLAALDI